MARADAHVSPASVAVADDGTVRSLTYDDVYHSRSGALAQARHVFLAGNGLLGADARWLNRDCFTILETGFGLGLNFLATWQAWRDSGATGRLHFVSIERHPLARDQLAPVLAHYGELDALIGQLLAVWPLPIAGMHRRHFDADCVTLTLAYGDASAILPEMTVGADAIFLDGFAPAKNPDMWSPRVLGAATRLCRPNASLATWCVTGEVRRQLGYRGWQLERVAGFGGKREMLVGRRSDAPSAVSPAPTSGGLRQTRQWDSRTAIIIGAGLAGCSLSERLCARGWQVTLIEREAEAAQAASGNPAGILLPRLALDDALAARLARSAYLYAIHTLERLHDAALHWQACGVLQLAEDEADERYQRDVVARLGLPESFVRYRDREAASAQLGLPTRRGGWWFAGGAWVAPRSLCRQLLRRCGDRLCTLFGTEVHRLQPNGDGWRALDATGKTLAEAAHLILANAQQANELLRQLDIAPLPVEAIRGQVSVLPTDNPLPFHHVVCGAAYATPAVVSMGVPACVGATFDRGDGDTAVRTEDHQRNMAALEGMFAEGAIASARATDAIEGRVGFRCMTRDKLPLVGALADRNDANGAATTLDEITRMPGLHVLTGLGARGLLWAPLAAELLASELGNEALPLSRTLREALDPARFILRSRSK